MAHARGSLALPGTVVGVLALLAAALLQCTSSGAGVSCASIPDDAAVTQSASVCYPDNDGTNGGSYTIELTVDDTGFTASSPDGGTKDIISTQNDAQVTLTLTNMGTKPHGFEVLRTSVCPAYADLPAGCSPFASFPSGSTIPPIEPGKSATVTFDTPTPDGVIYPFISNAPGDSSVPGLNDGQWSLI